MQFFHRGCHYIHFPLFFFAEGLALSRSQRYRIKRRGTIQKTISFWKNSHMFTRKVVCTYCLRSRPSNLLWRLFSKSAMSQRFDQWWIELTVCTSFLLTKHPGEKKASALPGELKIVLWLNWREDWCDHTISVGMIRLKEVNDYSISLTLFTHSRSASRSRRT